MAYRSLREFIDVLEAEGELVRVTEPVSTVLEMTEIQTPPAGHGRPGGAVRERRSAPTAALGHARAWPTCSARSSAWPWASPWRAASRTTAGELREVGELLAFLRQPEPPRGLKRRPGHAAAGQDRDGHAAEHGEEGPGAGGRADRRPDRPDQAADPDLLAGRARAADHLAAGGDQGPVARTARTTSTSASTACRCWARTRCIMRWLAHRGGAQHYAPPQEGRQARAPARLRRDRRRSRHHPGRRDAGARHPVGIPVRRPAARRQGRAGARPRPCR